MSHSIPIVRKRVFDAADALDPGRVRPAVGGGHRRSGVSAAASPLTQPRHTGVAVEDYGLAEAPAEDPSGVLATPCTTARVTR